MSESWGGKAGAVAAAGEHVGGATRLAERIGPVESLLHAGAARVAVEEMVVEEDPLVSGEVARLFIADESGNRVVVWTGDLRDRKGGLFSFRRHAFLHERHSKTVELLGHRITMGYLRSSQVLKHFASRV